MSKETGRYAVEIVKDATGEVVRRMDNGGEGFSERTAEKISAGAGINLNHDEYTVRLVVMPERENNATP